MCVVTSMLISPPCLLLIGVFPPARGTSSPQVVDFQIHRITLSVNRGFGLGQLIIYALFDSIQESPNGSHAQADPHQIGVARHHVPHRR
jgi:hypothetical protein